MSVNIKKNGTLTKLAGLYDSINLRLSQLLDTDISSLEDGQILAYNNETSKWENQDAPAGVEVVDDLTTQSATSALSANQGYVLNNALAGKANAADVLPTLITNPANKQILSYDSSSSKWVNTANGNTVLLGTADPAANLGKEGDLYVKLSSPSYGNSYRIHTKSTGGETASIDVDTITDGSVVATQNINYHWPVQTFPDFSTNYKSGNWSVTITSDNVYGRVKGSTISWPYFQTNDVTLTINPPSVYGIFVKSRGIWIQIGKSPVENFAELKDTNFNNLQNGQFAVYNSTTGKWENQNLPSSTDLFTITLTSSEDPETGETIYTADKLPSEVEAAYNNGAVIQAKVLVGEELTLSLIYTQDMSFFFGTATLSIEQGGIVSAGVNLLKDSSNDTWESIDFYDEHVTEPKIATISKNGNVYSCDLTPDEIDDAIEYDAGVVLQYTNENNVKFNYTLIGYADIYLFAAIVPTDPTNATIQVFRLDPSGNTEWNSITLLEYNLGSDEFSLEQTATTSTSANTVYTFTDARITVNNVVDVYTNIFGVSPSNIVLADGSCTVTFPAQSSAQSMTCKIYVK